MRRWVAVVGVAWAVAGCGAEPASDVCEQAARHREACVGDYVTPPECDEQAETQARAILASDCARLEQMQQPGKADGAFCDWFGAGCTPDEAIFTGRACARDADCAEGSCVERHCFAGVGSDDFARIMDRWTGSRETADSFTHVLVDNVEDRELRAHLIDGARASIHLTALLFEDDAVARDLAARLEAAARRGVQVRIVVDATTQYDFAKYAILEEMSQAGALILPYNPLTEWATLRWRIGITANERLHEKIFVVDGTDAIVGGRNVGEDYLADGKWRDTDVYLTGPGVADVQRMFLDIWDQLASWERMAGCPQQQSYGFYCPAGDGALVGDSSFYPAASLDGSARTRPVYSNPRVEKTPHGYLTYLNLVRSARSSILISNSYFVPPRRLRKHLKAAVARGVKVTVITNSLESTDAWWMYYASLNYYEELIKAGIEIRHYRGTETMHAKTMLVDGEVALIGSYNLDPRSAVSNSEALMLIRDGAAVDELKSAWDADHAYSDVAGYDLTLGEKLKAKTLRLAEPVL